MTNSSWTNVTVTPGNMKQQTETQRLEVIGSRSLLVDLRRHIYPSQAWLLNFQFFGNTLVSFQYVPLSFFFVFNFSCFFLLNPLPLLLETITIKIYKHFSLKKQLHLTLPCWNISKAASLSLHFHYLSSFTRLPKIAFDSSICIVVPSLQLLLQSSGRITFSFLKAVFITALKRSPWSLKCRALPLPALRKTGLVPCVKWK